VAASKRKKRPYICIQADDPVLGRWCRKIGKKGEKKPPGETKKKGKTESAKPFVKIGARLRGRATADKVFREIRSSSRGKG